MLTPRASASTFSGCAYSRSIRSRTRRSSVRSPSCWSATTAIVRLRRQPIHRAGVVIGDVHGAVRAGNRGHGAAPASAVVRLETGDQGLLRAQCSIVPTEERYLGSLRRLPV